MINLQNDNIFGYVDDVYKGHKIRLYGKVLSLNEGDQTAKMMFPYGQKVVVSNGIPMEAIELDESVLDSIKKGAARISKWLTKKYKIVSGLCRSLWNGIVLPVTNAVMIGQYANQGLLPEGVGFYASSETKAAAKQNGVAISDKAADYSGADKEDVQSMNDFWHKVMSRLGVNESNKGNYTMRDIKRAYLDQVTEDYGIKAANTLNENESFNVFFRDKFNWNDFIMNEDFKKYAREKCNLQLFEYAGDGEENPGVQSYKSENIPEVNAGYIVRQVMTQLKIAFHEGEFNYESEEGQELLNKLGYDAYQNMIPIFRSQNVNASDEEIDDMAMQFAEQQINQIKKLSTLKAVKPIMIWGAPGVGKTSIIQQTRAQFAKATGGRRNINMLEVVLSKMTPEDFQLPTVGEGGRSEEAPQSWLPIWKVTGNPEEDKIRDAAANAMGNFGQHAPKVGARLTNANGVEGELGNEEDNTISANSVVNSTPSKTIGNTEPESLSSDSEYASIDDIPKTDTPGKRFNVNGQGFRYDENGELRKVRAYKRRQNLGESYNINTNSKLNEGFADFMSKLSNRQSAAAAKPKIITDGGILFFDEITRTAKNVMNVIMNLINDRKFGEGWVMGSHWIIVAAGNRFYEMGTDSTWEDAYGTRFLQMTFVPKFEDWVKWAEGYDMDVNGNYSIKGPQRIDGDILDFLKDAKDPAWFESLSATNDKKKGPRTKANPRSWQTASNAIFQAAMQYSDTPIEFRGGEQYYNLPLEKKLEILNTAIGMGSASSQAFGKYHSFSKYFGSKEINNIWKYGAINKADGGTLTPGSINNLQIDPEHAKSLLPRGANADPASLMNLIEILFAHKPGSWANITQQELVNAFSWVIKVSIYNGGNSNNVALFIELINKYLSPYADQMGMKWGNSKDPNYRQFLLPIAKLYISFKSVYGGTDPSKMNDENIVNQTNKDVNKIAATGALDPGNSTNADD